MGIDLIGSGDRFVAVVESEKNMDEVVKGIVKDNKNVKTVLQKTPCTKGAYRIKETRLVWGDKNTEVLHKEHGYLIKVDPRKVYFSPRESTVRYYISEQVKPKEKVLVMFAGVGPYAVCISKVQPEVGEIVAVEMNPEGVRYMKENVRMNKISHLVTPVEGDVREVCKNYGREFDRVIMPMLFARDYIDVAAKSLKKGGTIHLYIVSEEKEGFKDVENFVSEAFKKLGVEYEISGKTKISLFAPGKTKILMEIKLK